MKKTKQVLLVILAVSILTGCEFVKNVFTYKDKTKEFIETLLKEDYDKAIDHFAMEHEMAKNIDIEIAEEKFVAFREIIVSNFGTDLKYSFMNAKKKFSNKKEESTPPNTTVVLIQFSNNKDFGVLKVLFDDNSGKILNIDTLDLKQPIPNMTYFWLFGFLALSVPIFNIYVIRQVKRSNLKRKWLKYLAIVVFNVSSINYEALNGLSFELFNLQILLGMSFNYMGYLNAAWSFGLPFGSLYWFWKLRQKKDEVIELSNDQNLENEQINENDIKH